MGRGVGGERDEMRAAREVRSVQLRATLETHNENGVDDQFELTSL